MKCISPTELEKKFWSNNDNALFYETVTLQEMKNLSTTLGLNFHPDLKLINEYILKANLILEVGAGFGRVLEYLIQKNNHANITAIERSQNFFNHLQQNFHSKVCLIHDDILSTKIRTCFDLVLLMWSGITDFMKHEQIDLLKKLFKTLLPGGYLIIDLISENVEPLNTFFRKHNHYWVQLNHSVIKIYNPSTARIQWYAKELKARYVTMIQYQSQNIHRRLFIIQK